MALYENFIYSDFPESIDSYEYMQDLTVDTYELIQKYQTLINQKKFNEASQYLIDNPELNRSMFNAIKYNKIIDSIKSIETLYSEDVRKYILELMSFKGEYSNLQKYIRYNVVNYNSMIYLCISDCPLGTLPINTKYWYPLSIKGDKGNKGDDGIGLHFSGSWSSSETYSKDAAVTYGTSLFASLVDNNLSHTPSSNTNSYWLEIINFSNVTAFDNSSVGTTTETTMQGALEELYSLSKTNKNNISINAANILSNTSSINTINSKLNGIENGAQKNTITGIKGSSESSYRTGNVNITPANLGITVVNNTADSNKSVKYATSAGSATSATNASNSDTVDGFHFQIGTTELEPGVSTLATKTFYFMYE